MGLNEHMVQKSDPSFTMLHVIFRILRHLKNHAFQGTFVSDVLPHLHNTMITLTNYLSPLPRTQHSLSINHCRTWHGTVEHTDIALSIFEPLRRSMNIMNPVLSALIRLNIQCKKC